MQIGLGIGIPFKRNAILAAFNPSNLFNAGEQGVWYDPSDINLAWRRNLLTYTEQFDNAAWTKTGATITPNAVTAPDGTLTADKLVEDSANTVHRVSIQSLSTVTGGTYTFSVYAKKAERDWLILRDVSRGLSAWVNLSTGVVGTVQAGLSLSISDMGNGWYRCTLVRTTEDNGVLWGIHSTTANGVITYQGDGTSGIYIWGAQLEVGSTASTYQRITDGVQDYFVAQTQPVLFQDSAGTTPVTAVEQPVGLMLDKSKGLVLGPERTSRFDLAGWVASTNVTVSNSEISFSGAAQNSNAYNPAGTVQAGKTYLLSITISSYTSGFAALLLPGGGGRAGITSVGTHTGIYTASTSGLIYVWAQAATNNTFTVSNISVRELPGNHAFQTTSTSRPVLSARYNLLTKTEQFDDSAWTKIRASIIPNVVTAPDGTLTADKLVEDTTAGNSHTISCQFAFSSGTSYTLSTYVKAAERGYVLILLPGAAFTATTFATFSLSDGTVTQSGNSPTTSAVSVGNGWWKVSITKTATATLSTAIESARISVSGTDSGIYTGDGTSGIYIWGADLRVTNDAAGQPAYQRVNTATDYNTTGFKPYLRFDGTDDWMQTNSINFGGIDKMTVFAGARKLSDAAAGIIAETTLDAAADAGLLIVASAIAGGANNNSWGVASGGYIEAYRTYTSPDTKVISSSLDSNSAPRAVTKLDGVVVTANSSAGAVVTSNFANSPIYIGRRGGTTLPFNGRIYGLIVRGAATDSYTIESIENYMGSKVGSVAPAIQGVPTIGVIL